jgi:predicted dehydrogenase
MHRSFERQLARFCDVVRTGAPPDPGLADGVAAVRAADAARRSAERDGREVEV